jgi:RNA polymerase sigma-70 factor, ECF subfamily
MRAARDAEDIARGGSPARKAASGGVETRVTDDPFLMRDKLAAREPGAFAALYDRLGGPMVRVAKVMLRSGAEAEDAVQDVFVELVRKRDRLELVRDLDAYVFAMLRHAVARRIERASAERRRLREVVPVVAAVAPEYQGDDLAKALNLLPVEQREVIALKIDGGLTFAQIAEVLNVSASTAASRYRYGLAKLRGLLE